MLFRKLHSADTPFKTNRFYSGSVSKHSFYFVHFYLHLCHKKKDRSTVSTSKHVRSTITCQAAPFDMWPLKAKQVSLRNGNKRERERDENTRHSESVDISVSSQESQSVLEMTEDWKMLSLFMQSAGSRRVDGEYSENTLALFHLTGARVAPSAWPGKL